MRKKIILILLPLLPAFFIKAQTAGPVLDRVIAVIGNSVVLESDLETQALQFKMSGGKITDDIKCKMFEQILFRKLLLVDQMIKRAVRMTFSFTRLKRK